MVVIFRVPPPALVKHTSKPYVISGLGLSSITFRRFPLFPILNDSTPWQTKNSYATATENIINNESIKNLNLKSYELNDN